METCIKRGVFSDLATLRCPKKNIYNGTIWILAVPCDGNYECYNDQDEQNCSIPDFVSIVILGTIMLISGFGALALWKSTTEILMGKNQMEILEELENLHGSDSLKAKMFEMQSYESANSINSRLVEVEMKIHEGVKSEVVCCIKVRIQNFSSQRTYLCQN